MVHAEPASYNVYVPWFVAGPDQPDVLLILMGIFLVLIVFLFGVLMLRLHHLPEHIAHREQKIQYQLVATLGLIGMFTHENLFWIAGLLLAIVDLPDFTGPLGRIANSVARLATRKVAEAHEFRREVLTRPLRSEAHEAAMPAPLLDAPSPPAELG